MREERLNLDEDDSNNYTAFLFSCFVPFTWTLSKRTFVISSVRNERMYFWCHRKGLMKFWCEALRCMVNGDAGKLTLFLLNRLQSAEESSLFSLSPFFFRSDSVTVWIRVCLQLSWCILSLLSLDMPITALLLSAWFIYWLWCNNQRQSSEGNPISCQFL